MVHSGGRWNGGAGASGITVVRYQIATGGAKGPGGGGVCWRQVQFMFSSQFRCFNNTDGSGGTGGGGGGGSRKFGGGGVLVVNCHWIYRW